MGRAGLCTIAFKQKPLEEVLAVAADTGASAVEVWGQPPHVSYPVDRSSLETSRAAAESHGLAIAAFGSYFQPGKPKALEGVTLDIENQVAAAEALGAGLIRIWPGSVEYEDSDEAQRASVYDEIRAFADRAGTAGIGVVLERHIGSLTHGWDAPARVLDEIGHPNVSLNYQIPYPVPVHEYGERSVDDYSQLLPRSRHAHIQNYLETPDGSLSRTLIDRGVVDYSQLRTVAEECGYDGYLMVEFAAEIRGGMSVVEAVAADIAYLDSLFG